MGVVFPLWAFSGYKTPGYKNLHIKINLFENQAL
jgi:hypothetical protein